MFRNIKWVLGLVAVVAALVSVAGVAAYLSLGENTYETLPTYFTYSSAELEPLRSLHSEKEMTIDDLYRWEDALYDLVSAEKIKTSSVSKILPYLLVAQRDAAYLSFNAHQIFKGTLDPVSREVACLFISDVCQELSIETDPFSERLAQIVIAKVKDRILEAEQTTKFYPAKSGDHYWSGKPGTDPKEYEGKKRGVKTWLIESASQFKVPEYPEYGSDEAAEQVQMVKDVLNNVTEDQRLAVIRWSGGPGTKGATAHWLDRASKHMRNVNFDDMARALMMRSVLQMTVWDAVTAASEWKYTHLVRRPFAWVSDDDPIFTKMPTPSSPSHPSTSTTIAHAAATVMSQYFPEERDQWIALAEEIGNSRLWGGVHFPKDVEQGAILGVKVAQESIQRSELVATGDVDSRVGSHP